MSCGFYGCGPCGSGAYNNSYGNGNFANGCAGNRARAGYGAARNNVNCNSNEVFWQRNNNYNSDNATCCANNECDNNAAWNNGCGNYGCNNANYGGCGPYGPGFCGPFGAGGCRPGKFARNGPSGALKNDLGFNNYNGDN